MRKQFEDPDLLLLDLQHRTYKYFLDAADVKTGLVADRLPMLGIDGHRSDRRVASIAACGFSLASHAVAASKPWPEAYGAEAKVLRLLRSCLTIVEEQNGFMYHFVDGRTGVRAFQSEVSSIDTAILVAGAMTAGIRFGGEVRQLTDVLIDRIQWRWLLTEEDVFSMGWTPENGQLPHRWDRYSELLLLVLIAMGSRSFDVPETVWTAWARQDVLHYKSQPYLSYPPLFVHQFSHAFFDFRGVCDQKGAGRNYWENSVLAHLAHVEFLEKLSTKFPNVCGHYSEELWGISSSDSESGYRDWGGPYQDGRIELDRGIDGTVVPSATAGGLPFVPSLSKRSLMFQYTTFADVAWGTYGFCNAFNPRTNWVSPDVIGIDAGLTLLMIENLLNGGVWKLFMQHDVAVRGMTHAGFDTSHSIAKH